LDREPLLDVNVLGREHLPHAAFTQLADDPITAVEDLPDQRRRRRSRGDRPRGWWTIDTHEVASITRTASCLIASVFAGGSDPSRSVASSMGAKIITKTDREMEDRMHAVADDPVRADTLQKARAFKRTWLELAEALSRAHEKRLWEK